VTTAPTSSRATTRGTLLRWIAWFGIANAALYGLVGLRYLLAFGMPGSGLATVYVALAYIGHFALLGFLPLMLLLGPVALLLPRKGLLMVIGIPVAAAGLTILALDTNVFAQYRYHMSALTAEISKPPPGFSPASSSVLHCCFRRCSRVMSGNGSLRAGAARASGSR
jgi:membrane-anchored protein YejM (alkaline phosphatase superfamily)